MLTRQNGTYYLFGTGNGVTVWSSPDRQHWTAGPPVFPTPRPEAQHDVPGTFGSFWSGIKLVRLRPDLTGPAEPQQWRTLARRPRNAALTDSLPGDGAIEGPFIFRRDEYYYLFVSFDYCCRGPQSTYKMMVGRARAVTGPYLDEAGTPLEQGGPLVLQGDADWYGVGHNAVATFDKVDYLLFHGYDAHDHGRPKLRIEPLAWSPTGWPTVARNP